MSDIGIRAGLQAIARRAWQDSRVPAVCAAAKKIDEKRQTVRGKVQEVVDLVRDLRRQSADGPLVIAEGFAIGKVMDTDDAVLLAATFCLSIGIRCRIVGARYGQSWTCWLGYYDGDWFAVDVLKGESVAEYRKPDEEVVEECSTSDAPADMQLDVSEETSHTTSRFVIVRAKNPDIESYPPIELTVGGSISSYRPDVNAPSMQLPKDVTSRRQWELVKRMGDQAWSEYERRFLK